MAGFVGLRFALTVCGMIEIVVPYVFGKHVSKQRTIIDSYFTSLLLRIHFTRSRGQFLLRRLKHGIINTIRPRQSPLLSLPFEIRDKVYQAVCTPNSDGRVTGALHVLLLNKQIYQEARSYFDQIEHTIRIGDLERYKAGSLEFMGLPRIIQVDDCISWHMGSLKHLALQVNICGISTMTPDCFDVFIAHNGKEQWRNLKRLIGIWPETREVPLESVRLELHLSKYNPKHKTYRADFIRIIRNFKRTRVWAETGDCSKRKSNKSMLLPLVRAFNQGRRNWVKESDVDNNLIVRYDQHMLDRSSVDLPKTNEDAEEKFQEQRQKWSIVPSNDTSRSDSAVWPEWTGKEEKYIHDKMIRKENSDEREFECRHCLAAFEKPGELRQHVSRGRWRAL